LKSAAGLCVANHSHYRHVSSVARIRGLEKSIINWLEGSRPGLCLRLLRNLKRPFVPRHMKINWFSPLPPAKSSVAGDYLVGILPALSRDAEVILWTDQNTWDSSLEKLATVRRFRPERMSWPDLNYADVSFYNIGNNYLFHTSIWQVSRQHPGIVILHDLRVHNFFESLYRGQWRDVDGYLSQIKRYYGNEGLHAAMEFVNSGSVNIDHMSEHYPLTPLALENCLGVVVHSEEAFKEVERMREWPVALAALPRSLPAVKDGHPMEARQAGPPYRLIMFGYMGRNRRLENVLEALSGLSERDSFRLDIFGDVADARSLRRRVKGLDLERLVHLHGYTPEARLNEMLRNSHLAINLRYPTMGEASGSQLRIWYHALPSLVTSVGWYSSLPGDTVAHVRPEFEVDDIRNHLASFLKEPSRFVKMGERGRSTLLQQHDPEKYVRSILNFAANSRQFAIRKTAYDLARRSGKIMGSLTKGTVAEPKRVAEKIYEICSP
jgi:glycosyltransferase involved in cell wall biosynthesis